MAYVYGKRPDGFGTNVCESNGYWNMVFICPECRFNEQHESFPSEDSAVAALEEEIRKHKESGKCSHVWFEPEPKEESSSEFGKLIDDVKSGKATGEILNPAKDTE